MKQKTAKSNESITKDFLEKDLLGFSEAIRSEIRFGMNQISEIFDQKLTKHTDLILTTVDPLLKELETRREDREIGTEQYVKVVEKIGDHEKRIKHLEKIQPVA